MAILEIKGDIYKLQLSSPLSSVGWLGCTDASSSSLKGRSPPVFGRCLLWPNGRPSQVLLSTCFTYWLPDRILIKWD